jgi:hypothetical protein
MMTGFFIGRLTGSGVMEEICMKSARHCERSQAI